jgi:hypothetical protein
MPSRSHLCKEKSGGQPSFPRPPVFANRRRSESFGGQRLFQEPPTRSTFLKERCPNADSIIMPIPIIVFRCAVGGTTWFKDWLPPSAVKRAGGTDGPLYKRLVNRFHNRVGHLNEFYPNYKGQGHEVAAFVWLASSCHAPPSRPEPDLSIGKFIN